MFGEIAPTYDLLNSLLSVNLHKRWRSVAVRRAGFGPGDGVLDVATGTGDLALVLARTVGPSGQVVGVDFCEPMLAVGRAKIARKRPGRVVLLSGSAEALPFPDQTFDGATMGFALRNVTDVARTLREMARVVRPGGRVVNLELTRPRHPWLRWFYDFYSGHGMPFVGGIISGRREAYTYLPYSIRNFLPVERVKEIMQAAGLDPVWVYPLAGGIATIHVGVKCGGDQ
jgi:demethylmenaquinone methyltransferase/2-methoxy-6-polyprenyl-1,4-benzoquinol methylase